METKSRILEQSTSLFMRYGLKSITMDDVARELGMSKKTLYQFVDNKADLINQIISTHIEIEKEAVRIIGTEARDPIEELLLIAKHVIQLLRQTSPTVMYDLQKYYHQAWQLMERFHREFIYNVILRNIESGIAKGIYRSDVNADIIAKLYVSKSLILVDEELFPLKYYNTEKLFTQYISYHIHGIASPKGLKLLDKHTKTKS